MADAVFLASAKVALPPGDVTAERLPDPGSAGAALVAQYCTACHALPTPQLHSASDWPPVARRMWLRIEGLDRSFGVPNPTSVERVVVLRYLMEHALKVHRTALPAGAGRDAFVAACGRCHELPAPDTHTPDEWREVVMRMGELTASMVGQPLGDEELSAIVGYLESATRERAPAPESGGRE